ncbi:MAG TPA: DUF2336 domain-containing protein [Sphingomicrobium sp.]|nr:DUF2336 domain-containing protein [Sphingomicrobium sp.]
MVPEEWPIAAPAADPMVAPARRAGRDRLSTVRLDFFLDPGERLNEQERAVMAAMLHGLVSDIADELRAALPTSSAVANDEDNSELVAELRAAGLLDRPKLIELLLRRADEEQIATAVRARNAGRDGRLLQTLVSDENASISAAAMALILARGRRRDRFGQARVEFDDIPAEAAAELVQIVGAGLRQRLLVTLDRPAADRQLAAAAAAMLARHDEDKRLEALATLLVRLLDEQGRLDEDFIAAAAADGEAVLVAEALARRAAIAGESAFNLLLGGDGGSLMLLLRMASASRELAARLLAGPGDLLEIADAGRAIARFDAMTQDEVDAAREWLRLDPSYRAALSALGQDHGQRPL